MSLDNIHKIEKSIKIISYIMYNPLWIYDSIESELCFAYVKGKYLLYSFDKILSEVVKTIENSPKRKMEISFPGLKVDIQ